MTNGQQTIPRILEVRGLHKTVVVGFRRHKVHILKGVDLDVREGDVFGLLGPNGAGKTTTLKVALGLMRPSAGAVTLGVDGLAELGYLPENPYFYDHLTAREFLDLCGTLSGLAAADRGNRIAQLLEELDLARAGSLPMRKFSKGMVQRVGLAQAMLARPDFLVLDEPMSGLDPLGRRLVRDLIMRLKGEGATILMSSHVLPDVEHLCDRVGILRRGELRACLTLSELSSGARGGGEVRVRGLRGAERRWPGNPRVEAGVDTTLFQLADARLIGMLLEALLAAGAEVVSVQREQRSLEEVFVHLLHHDELPPEQLRAS